MNQVRHLWLLGSVLVCVSVAGSAAEHSDVILDRNVAVTMRDGTILRADIYRPKAEGKFAVLLARTPYDKQGERETAVRAAERGYVAIAQDVRGRYESDGEWYPL